MKTAAYLATLIGMVLCGCFLLAPAAANQGSQQEEFNQAIVFEYATLSTAQNGNFVFDVGGEVLPRTLSLNALFVELGGKGRPTFANLLNEIGADGWELIQVTDAGWLFKRIR